jgi:hypothetical protein
MPYDADLEYAHQACTNHRQQVLASERCGCFYCLKIFKPEARTEWTDTHMEDGIGTTAFCPRCGIDAVIGSASGYPIELGFLRRMRRYWF